MREKAMKEHNHEGLRSSRGYNIVHFRDLYNFILGIINLAKNEVKRQHLFRNCLFVTIKKCNLNKNSMEKLDH